MAEMNPMPAAAGKSKKRSHSSNPRVDLTPMVDLGFILITFFLFATSLSQPKVTKLNMPKDRDVLHPNEVCASCVLTIISTGANELKYYEGDGANPKMPPQFKTTEYSPAGIRQVIAEKKQKLMALRGHDSDMVVILKAMPEATYASFMALIDELQIGEVERYAVVEPGELELKLLAGMPNR